MATVGREGCMATILIDKTLGEVITCFSLSSVAHCCPGKFHYLCMVRAAINASIRYS